MEVSITGQASFADGPDTMTVAPGETPEIVVSPGQQAQIDVTTNEVFPQVHDVATRVTGVNVKVLRALVESGAMEGCGTRRGLLGNLFTAKLPTLNCPTWILGW